MCQQNLGFPVLYCMQRFSFSEENFLESEQKDLPPSPLLSKGKHWFLVTVFTSLLKLAFLSQGNLFSDFFACCHTWIYCSIF